LVYSKHLPASHAVDQYNPMTAIPIDPKPGSPEARKEGCTCAPVGNNNGRGIRGDGFTYGWMIDVNCRIHNNGKRRAGLS
jgi:hypothetical protein